MFVVNSNFIGLVLRHDFNATLYCNGNNVQDADSH
jgi:hypothetical protein